MTARGWAPAAFAAWDELVGAVVSTTPPDLMQLARTVVGAALGAAEQPQERSASVAFAEQVVVDVASLDDGLRSSALAELGGGAAPFVLALWVEDMTVRADRALGEMLGGGLSPRPVANSGNAWAEQEKFLFEVAKLDALDPVTTELVRLRGARAHNCRLCQSRRNVTAVDLTGTGELLDVETPTGLSPAQDAALRVVDAFVWTPLHWPDGLGAEVAALLGPAQAAELALDIVRNAANKIAVAFAADAPQVETGVEYFAIDPASGELRYGVLPGRGA
jgi:alkylhydroperoxidase family enzyme